MTVCQIFFKLKFSKCIQNFRTLNVFGNFFLIVYINSTTIFIIYLMARGFGRSFVSKVRIEYRCCTVLVQTLCSSWSLDFSSLEHLSPKLTSTWPKKTRKSKNTGTQELAIFNWISLDALLCGFWKDVQWVRFSKVILINW